MTRGQSGSALGPGLNTEVAETHETMSRHAARIIATALEQRPELLLCASAGATPRRTYELVTARCRGEPRLFEKLRVVQIDEWGGLEPENVATCAADLKRHLVEPLRLAADRFMSFRTDAPNPKADCERMSRWLRRNGPIDLCILGLGLNGHIAMNEPADAFVPGPHVARLAPSSKQHGMLRDLAEKPRYGLTLGLGDILSSREILLLVSGEKKRAALARLLEPTITPRFPASFLWLHRRVTVLCDRAALPGS